jgi:hypothetical protein
MPAYDPKTLLSDTIRNAAVLFRLNTTAPGKTRLDKDASQQSDRQHNAVVGASSAQIKRLPGSAGRYDDKLRKLQSAARNAANEMTSPWGNTGARLLPNGRIMAISGVLKDFQQEFDGLKAEMIPLIPALLKEAENNKGTYNVQIPTADELMNGYTLTQQIEPLPDAKSFSALPKEVAALLARNLEAMTTAAYNQSKEHMLNEMLRVVEKAIERVSALDAHNPNSADRTPALHESVIGNIQAQLDVFASFNLENNPRWAEIVNFMERTLRHASVDDLKQSSKARKDVLVNANEAKKKLVDLKDLLIPGF